MAAGDIRAALAAYGPPTPRFHMFATTRRPQLQLELPRASSKFVAARTGGAGRATRRVRARRRGEEVRHRAGSAAVASPSREIEPATARWAESCLARCQPCVRLRPCRRRCPWWQRHRVHMPRPVVCWGAAACEQGPVRTGKIRPLSYRHGRWLLAAGARKGRLATAREGWTSTNGRRAAMAARAPSPPPPRVRGWLHLARLGHHELPRHELQRHRPHQR